MAWFKVDDRLTVSSKVMRIPRVMRIEAMGLWVMCGAWSARDLTDGFIPAYVVDELGGTNDITTAAITKLDPPAHGDTAAYVGEVHPSIRKQQMARLSDSRVSELARLHDRLAAINRIVGGDQ